MFNHHRQIPTANSCNQMQPELFLLNKTKLQCQVIRQIRKVQIHSTKHTLSWMLLDLMLHSFRRTSLLNWHSLFCFRFSQESVLTRSFLLKIIHQIESLLILITLAGTTYPRSLLWWCSSEGDNSKRLRSCWLL